MANPARAAGGLPGGGMIPSGSSVDSLRALVGSADFQNLPPAIQQQILDRLGPAANDLIPSAGGGMTPPPPRDPPVIRIPGGEPDGPPGGRLPQGDPQRLPGPSPDAPKPKERFPWETAAAALGLGGLAAGIGGIASYFSGEDPNLAGAAAPLNMDPALGRDGRAGQAGGGRKYSLKDRARNRFWAEQTDTPVATVAEMFAADPDKAFEQLDMMATQKSIDRKRAAKDRWRATAMLAGGSHNINSGNRGAYNILNELQDEDRDRALLYMTPAGPMAAAVDARDAERAAAMAQRAVEGMAGRIMTPQQQALAQAQVDQANRQKPVEEQAMAFVQQPDIHPTELDAADSYVSTMYSTPDSFWTLGGNSSYFTIAEQQQTVDYLVRNRGYTQEKAQRIVDEIARRRTASSWRGNPMR